jgi:hypothetical protein
MSKKRDEWNVGKVFHANAGEIYDGIRLLGKDGKPFKRRVPVVIIQSRYFSQICKAWMSAARAAKEKA